MMTFLEQNILLANASYPMGEHLEKVSELMNLFLPIGVLLLGFFCLGLAYSWYRWGKFSAENERLMEKNQGLRNFHHTLAEEKEALLELISDDYIDSKEKLVRREEHVKELHIRLVKKQEEIDSMVGEISALSQERLDQAQQEAEENLNQVRLAAETERDNHYARVLELNQELMAHQEEIQQLKSLSDNVESLEVQNEQLHSLLSQQEAEIDQVNAYKVEIGKLQARLAEKGDVETELSELRAQLARDDKDLEILNLRSELEHAKGWEMKANSLILDVTERDRKISALKDQISAPVVEQELVEVTVIEEEDFTHEREMLQAFEGEVVESHHRFGVIYSEAPTKADDLKKISGVGETLEEELNKFGVYRYKQIALWTPQVINEFVEDLPFGDRVTREDWIKQASELHERKYCERIN